jgi:hypothetical protein
VGGSDSAIDCPGIEHHPVADGAETAHVELRRSGWPLRRRRAYGGVHENAGG